MVTRSGVRDLMTQGALVAGLAVSVSAVAQAQTASPTAEGAPAQSQAPAFSPSPLVIPQVNVEGAAPPNTLRGRTGIDRLPDTIQDTPQTINVVPQEVLRQQNVTTLEQALRNVPGITASAGEGNGGVAGDQFRIRGFNAQNDLFSDGLRDFGTYVRDAFTTEEVQVLKGPSGFALGGAGTVGGGVNQVSRMPHLGNSYGGVATGGMGPFARATADVNVQVGESSAVRLNMMGQSSHTVDRDGQDQRRWGIAPSVAFGLGTDTTATLEYLHYEYDQATESGVPVVTPFGGIGRPATEYGLRRRNWYGNQGDRDKVEVNRLTATLQHRVNDWLTLNDSFRTSWVKRDFAYSPVTCGTGATLTAFNNSCSGQFLAGRNPNVGYGGGIGAYTQDTWGIQNIATANARFDTWMLRHELTAGVDIAHESTDRTGLTTVGTRLLPGIRNPDNDYSLGFTTGSALRNTDTTNLGLFMRDRVWLIPELSVIGGFRYTHYNLDYTAGNRGAAPTTDISTTEDFVDPTASLVFEPTPAQTYYFSYSTSTTPPGANFTTVPFTVNPNVEPERNQNFEVGAKVGVFDNRLGLYASLFRINKKNATTPLEDGTVYSTSDRQRVQGAEAGVTGRITPAWNVNANYTYLDSETTRSTTAANVGNRVQYVPKHAASLWTTYEIAPQTPYNITLGGGMFYRSSVYLNAANSAKVPSNLSFDAMVSHKLAEQLTLSVNGYNLGNALNYDSLFSGRVIPSAGRTVLVSLAANF
ncbi:MAG: TonB-dependent siderophore receptor [Roseomonas mucosa]|nr:MULTISPECIES: TonB-dependent siderophore receptor [Roseomonas]MDT8352957.1 TonB-dependent siderophore receptor [Roseomonas mucosa]MDU7522705.1 TonB-dependent siderophore receptor [Roseomonas mucosa]USQ70887.1 TonB-dependent siderophore receptor [Roseomonas mucosa]